MLLYLPMLICEIVIRNTYQYPYGMIASTACTQANLCIDMQAGMC